MGTAGVVVLVVAVLVVLVVAGIVVLVLVVAAVDVLAAGGEVEATGTVGALDSRVALAPASASPVVVVPDPQAAAPIVAAATTTESDLVRFTGATVSDGPGATLAPWALRAFAS
jgi:hypothetical protein